VIPHVGIQWSNEIGAVNMLLDEQKVLTDETLDEIATFAALDVQLSGLRMGARRRSPDRAVRSVVRGVSRDHPSIQLADLVAGAGQATARRHSGLHSPAGDRKHSGGLGGVIVGCVA